MKNRVASLDFYYIRQNPPNKYEAWVSVLNIITLFFLVDLTFLIFRKRDKQIDYSNYRIEKIFFLYL